MRLVTKGLNRNERLIIILYYYEELTMKEIGQTLGLSESRVSQMHSSIVARLQDQLRKRRPEFS
jgi:RNA polymerase sigma factor for flagellar operon FliA